MDICLLYDFLIQTTTLIIGAFVGGEIIKHIYSPQVQVKAKKTNLRKDVSGFFVSLNIVNIGRTVANNCVSYILFDNEFDINTLLEREDAMADECLPSYKDEKNNFQIPRNQLTRPSSFKRPSQARLCWSNLGNPHELDINPGVITSIDICRFQSDNKGGWYVMFPTERGWRKILLRMKVDGNSLIAGKIVICPSNDSPKILFFTMKFQNNEPSLIIKDKYLTRQMRNKILLND